MQRKRRNVRLIAGFIVSVTFALALQKGILDWVPDSILLLGSLSGICLWVYWIVTHEQLSPNWKGFFVLLGVSVSIAFLGHYVPENMALPSKAPPGLLYASKEPPGTPEKPAIKIREPKKLETSHGLEITYGEVQLSLAVGDDDALHAQGTHNADKPGDMNYLFVCSPPFTCFSEEALKSHRVELKIGTKKWGRMFFQVANTGNVNISHPTVAIASQTKGVSVYFLNQRSQIAQNSIEMLPTITVDLIPYSVSDSAYDFVADLAVDDGVSDFEVGLRIFAPNLKARTLLVFARAIR